MSLRPETRTEVPSSTAAVARAAFPRGNPYLRLRDALGTVFSDAQFADLLQSWGRAEEAPWPGPDQAAIPNRLATKVA
jgi:hypothetical protein